VTAAAELDVSAPAHGWATVRIRIGSDEVRCRVSYIVDSLTDLVYAAHELHERRAARPVIFFEEPEATRMAFAGDDDRLAVRITQHPDLGAARSDRDGRARIAASVEREALVRAIWSASRRLEDELGCERIEAAWRNEFPTKEIAQLGQRLAGR
jgi:hypothetical protein